PRARFHQHHRRDRCVRGVGRCRTAGRRRARRRAATLGLKVPVRSADAELADAFFVSAVATLLLIRIGLEATGYPRLAGGGLHIAHVLWGGLGMLVALGLLLLFLSPFTRLLAAIVGGAGFGAFIDELGKFVTADNDYFFQPTAALVYVFFAVMFLAVRQIRRFRRLSPRESLVHANGGNGVTSWIQILSGFIAGVLIVRGLLALRRSRLHAYRAFELAVLVDLLLAQPFAFLTTGFGAAADVFIDLALLAALRF